MFVIASWLSFIIKPEIVPGRISLLVTTFLVLVNIFNSTKLQAPVSKNLNAIDAYLVGCIGHVFVALMEYAFVLYMDTNKISIFSGCNNKTSNLKPSIGSMTNFHMEDTDDDLKYKYCNNRIDGTSLIVFPVCFATFIFVYVVIYA